MRRRVGAAAVLAAALSLGATLSPAGASAGNAATGKHIGMKAERHQALSHDVSAPLRNLPAARPVRAHDHPDSPMPTPSGPVVADPVTQGSTTSATAPSASASFPGVGANGSAPSDSNGAVGPNDYFDLVNARLEIFTKSGTSILGPVATNTLWSGFGGECQAEDDGDGTVRYDALADRWIVAQFALGPSGNGPFLQCLAVSTTADPTGSYYRYAFSFSNFPDYPKIAVWPDAYYQTMNMFNSTGAFIGADSCAYDRTRMLVGAAADAQCFNTTTTYGAILPADLDGVTPPPPGAPDMQIGLGRDNTHLASFAFHVDWTPGYTGTTLTESDVPVASYSAACGGGVCVPQLGTTQLLDSLADRMMYRYAYRNLGDHESWVVTYSVDAAGSAAPRWFELRRTPPATSGPLTVYQDSTYAPDSTYRWMGSAAMDQAGDIALGYSESSPTMKPAIAYTGHQVSDALDTMEPEQLVLAGTGAQTGGLDRWGDYSSMSVDPSDGCTFWYTNQYIPADGKFNWATQIASFGFPACTPRTDSDFSLAVFPVSAVLAAPGSVTTTISTDRTAGAAQNITLSASGAPPGINVTFSPTTVTTGLGASGTSTMTVTAAAGTAPGTYTIGVTASGATTSHLASYTFTIPGSTITNGGFETGDFTGWNVTSGAASVLGGVAHTGADGAQLGATTATDGDSTIAQSFTLAQASTLSFWYDVTCPDTLTYDWATATLTDTTTGTTTTILPKTCVPTSGWTQVSASLGSSLVGHAFTLSLTSHDDNYPGDPTYTYFDDAQLSVNLVPDFTLFASPASQTVVAGTSASYTATVSSVNGFAGSVALAVGGLPTGATATFNPTTVVASGSSTLTVATTSGTAPGSYTLTVTGTSGTLTHTSTVGLVVNPAPDFALSATPASQTVVVGGATTYSAGVSPINGFSGSVSLDVTGLPTGTTANFNPGTIVISGTATLSVSTSIATPPGTYPLAIVGTSGSIVHTVTTTLVVSPPPNFAISATPSNQSVRRGASAVYVVTITPSGGFTSLVNLTMISSPPGLGATFSPATLASGQSRLTVTTGSATGSYSLAITGTSGSLTHSVIVTLIVTKH